METLIIRFTAEVSKESVDKLLNIIDSKAQKYKKNILLISSTNVESIT